MYFIFIFVCVFVLVFVFISHLYLGWMLELVLPEHITLVHSGIYHLSPPIHSYVGDKLRILLAKLFLSKLHDVFSQIAKLFCLKMPNVFNLSRTYHVSYGIYRLSLPIHSYVGDKLRILLAKLFLYKLHTVFSRIAKLICSKLTNVFDLSRTYYVSYALLLFWHLSPFSSDS